MFPLTFLRVSHVFPNPAGGWAGGVGKTCLTHGSQAQAGERSLQRPEGGRLFGRPWREGTSVHHQLVIHRGTSPDLPP